MSSIEWQEWSEETFARAKAEGKPILLFLTASWCRWCKAMEQDTFSRPEVCARVSREYIPVHVDKDRRPDLNARYNMGGWPSTVFLTPDGEVITGSTFFHPRELLPLLEKIARTWREHPDRIEEKIREMIRREEEEEARASAAAPGEAPLTLDIITNVSRSIYCEFDEKHGGFGTGQKFPHSEAVDFALLQYHKTKDLKLFGVLEKTLSGMADGGLFDSVEGGFFRFCAARDWRAPHTEKLLETNVRLLGNYLDAGRVMGRSAYLEVARKTAAYICANLWDRERGAFFGSQDADEDYYQLDALQRKSRKPPQVDRTIYTDVNALAASVFLQASVVLKEPLLEEMALAAIDFLLENLYSPERGAYHYFDTNRHIRGLLSDQIHLAQALMHAVEYAGRNRYLEVIRDLIETTVKNNSANRGGFYDISGGRTATGSLKRRNRSILENAVMAGVLIRYHYLTFEEEYLRLAERTLRAFAEDYHLYGYFTAGYARYVDLYFYKPLYVIILGERESTATAALRKAATGIYLPSRVVQTIDPEEEPELVERMRFPIGKEPKAYVCLEQACHAAVQDPRELETVMAELDAHRPPRR